MRGFRGLEYRSGFVASNFAGISLPPSRRENSLLKLFVRTNHGFVACGNRLARLCAAGIFYTDKFCRSGSGVGMDYIC